MMKPCTKCSVIKPLNEFRKNPLMTLGADSWCLACVSDHKARERKLTGSVRIYAPVREKRCYKCTNTKPIGEFSRDAGAKDGHCGICVPCRAKKHLERKAKCHDKIKAQSRDAARRRISTPSGKVHHRLRSQLQYLLKVGKGGKSWQSIVGYSTDNLRLHLERQFLPGMSWENVGEWHIDHIVPISAFEITGADDPSIRDAWAITNLRPLWAEENINKRDRRTHLI